MTLPLKICEGALASRLDPGCGVPGNYCLVDTRKSHFQSLDRSNLKSCYGFYSQLIVDLQTLGDWSGPDNSENHPSNDQTFQSSGQTDRPANLDMINTLLSYPILLPP